MTEVTKYLEALKEIRDFDKANKLNLDSSIVTALVNQIGVDFRLRKDNPTKSETKQPEFFPCTEPQIKVLKSINKFTEGLSKAEAWAIINDSKNKKE